MVRVACSQAKLREGELDVAVFIRLKTVPLYQQVDKSVIYGPRFLDLDTFI